MLGSDCDCMKQWYQKASSFNENYHKIDKKLGQLFQAI
jgi:uncharacterized protein YukE